MPVRSIKGVLNLRLRANSPFRKFCGSYWIFFFKRVSACIIAAWENLLVLHYKFTTQKFSFLRHTPLNISWLLNLLLPLPKYFICLRQSVRRKKWPFRETNPFTVKNDVSYQEQQHPYLTKATSLWITACKKYSSIFLLNLKKKKKSFFQPFLELAQRRKREINWCPPHPPPAHTTHFLDSTLNLTTRTDARRGGGREGGRKEERNECLCRFRWNQEGSVIGGKGGGHISSSPMGGRKKGNIGGVSQNMIL